MTNEVEAEVDSQDKGNLQDVQNDRAAKNCIADEPADEADAAPLKPKRGRGRIILLSVLVVLVVLFGGGGVVYATQHDNPNFCNAICHVPMDPYVASYNDNVSINPAEVGATGAGGTLLSVSLHKNSEQDIKCITCHNDGIDAQISEGISWVTGNYTVPLEGFKLVASESPGEGQVSGVKFCLREGCHTSTTLEELQAATKKVTFNGVPVHEGHHDNRYADCSSCHKVHEQSVLVCSSSCHANVKPDLPNGWLKTKATK